MPNRRSARDAGTANASASGVASPRAISLGVAAFTWLAGWVIGNIAGSLVLLSSGQANVAVADRPVWLSAAMAVALWTPQIVALAFASRTFATGSLTRDFSLRFMTRDLIGIPIGVLSQVVLLRLVYWPLQAVWPHTFANKQLERNARDLYEGAGGVWVMVLVIIIVVGAPWVEELVYRGLLQGAARRQLNDVVAVFGVAGFFALIHFRPVEYPGLFVFGLVLGSCQLVTNRLGMSIVTHMAFNATALVLVAR